MKINEILNLKTLLVLGAVLLLLGVAISVDFLDLAGLEKGSVIQSISKYEDPITGEGYALITISGSSFKDAQIGAVDPTASRHYDVDGEKNSKGEELEGDFDVRIGINVIDTGFEIPVAQKTVSQNYLDSVYWKPGLLGIGGHQEKTFNGVMDYYQVSDQVSMRATYEIWAIVNGEELEKITVTPASSATRTFIIPGTTITWEESGTGFDSRSRIPANVGNLDIIEGSDKKLHFIKYDRTVDVIEYWNAIWKSNDFTYTKKLRDNKGESDWDIHDADGNKVTDSNSIYNYAHYRTDLNSDNGCGLTERTCKNYDINTGDSSASNPIKFTKDDLIDNNHRWRTNDIQWPGLDDWIWAEFPSMEEEPFVSSVKGEENFMIKTAATSGQLGGIVLKYDTPLIIEGTFKIPFSYGDVMVRKTYPKPVITNPDEIKFDETIWTGLTNPVITVKVRNDGETGEVVVTPEALNATGNIVIPPSQSKVMAPGEKAEFVFVFEGQTEGVGTVRFSVTGGMTTVTHEFDYVIEDLDLSETNLYNIRILAVNKEGTPLGNEFSIHVTATGQTMFGEWIGQVPEGETTVSGKQVEAKGKVWYPENAKKINVDSDESYIFEYSLEPPKEKDGISFIWYILGGIIFGILILGAYMYASEKELFKR